MSDDPDDRAAGRRVDLDGAANGVAQPGSQNEHALRERGDDAGEHRLGVVDLVVFLGPATRDVDIRAVPAEVRADHLDEHGPEVAVVALRPREVEVVGLAELVAFGDRELADTRVGTEPVDQLDGQHDSRGLDTQLLSGEEAEVTHVDDRLVSRSPISKTGDGRVVHDISKSKLGYFPKPTIRL